MPNSRIKILGEDIDNLSSEEVSSRIKSYIRNGVARQVITVNSEFLVAAQTDAEFRSVLHNSSLNLADSIGILWAAKFLSLPLTDFPILSFLLGGLQIIFSGLAIIFAPGWIRSVIVEKNSGTDLIWNIARLSSQENYSIFLLGGFGDTSQLAARALLQRYPKLRICGTYAGSTDEQGIVERINRVNPDILLVAYGPIRQEKWIHNNLPKLQISVAIGLGGTFDYLAGKKPLAPQILRYIGLEWAFRLITQPYRILRIFKAVFVFSFFVLMYKLQALKPYRKNVVACVVNERKEILICKRIFHGKWYTQYNQEHWQLPQGGVDHKETEEEALQRELFEETGIKGQEILGKILNAHHYDWPLLSSMREYEGKYRGQSQTIFYVRVESKDINIKLDFDEFNEYKWISKNELLQKIHPVRKGLIEIVYHSFDKYVK